MKKKKKILKKKKPVEKKRATFDDPEIEKAFTRMDKMRHELTDKLDALYKEGGISPKDVTNFLDDSTNFPKPMYERIQQQREKLLEEIWVKLGKKAKERHIKKKKKKMAGARKRKTLGGRKKWIPMR